jgi:hypothetical protein
VSDAFNLDPLFPVINLFVRFPYNRRATIYFRRIFTKTAHHIASPRRSVTRREVSSQEKIPDHSRDRINHTAREEISPG